MRKITTTCEKGLGLLAALAVLACVLCLQLNAADNVEEIAGRLMESTGTSGGLVVHVNSGDGRLTAAFRLGDNFVVHGLESDAAKVEAARQYIRDKRLYGEVSVEA